MLYKRINYFLEVANCLSFTEAAKRKYITQQAMTWQISCLEKDLGVQLFVRSTRSVNLTPAGKMLRDEFIKIDQDIRIALDRVKGLNLDNSATISIGFFDALSVPTYIEPIVLKLQKEIPNVTFDIVLDDMISLRNNLMDGKIDICITTSTDWQMWPGVDAYVLKQIPFRVFLSHKHPLAHMRPLDLNALANENMYALPSDQLSRKAPYWQRYIPRKNIITLSRLNSVLINLELCRGFAVLPGIFDAANSGQYNSYPLPFDDALADLIILRRQDSTNNSLVNVATKTIRLFFKNMK